MFVAVSFTVNGLERWRVINTDTGEIVDDNGRIGYATQVAAEEGYAAKLETEFW